MRLEEFANVQDQLDLWKLVSDAVWAGINTQRQQQAQQAQQAQVAAQSKAQPKPRAKRAGAKGASAKPIKIPVPKAPPQPVPTPQQKPAQAAAISISKGHVAVPAAAPLKPGIAAAQAPRVFGQPVVRTVTPPGARPPAPATPLSPQQRWLNRRPWGPQSHPNASQIPQTALKSRLLPLN